MTEKTSVGKQDKTRRAPPRSIPWWTLVALLLVCVLGVWIGTRWGDRIAGAVREVAHRVEGEKETASEPEGGAATYYTCGMHPWVILPRPGNCPICHMKLTPLDPEKFTGEMVIDPTVVQNIGVRVAPVTEGPLTRAVRTVGNVDYDETGVRDINTKLSGWIEKLYVDYEGAPVEAGDRLFEVYSPALLTAEEEYLLALRNRRSQDQQAGGIDMVDSARTKLELFDITAAQIDALAKAGKASRTMTLLSPYSGVVIAKHANEGMKIDPGMQVFRIADLSKVWVLVTLYESQLPFVSLDQEAVMSLPYIPGQTFTGRVVYIYPYVNTKTREVQVRLEFDNSDGLLKPGMYATVDLKSTLRERATLVPREAVISTGKRDIAFVSLGEGRFEPRQVRLGVEPGDGRVEVVEGLKPGEMVVTSGQFLLDSESRVREALAKMIRGDEAAAQKTAAVTAGGAELSELPGPVSEGLRAALDAYFQIGGKLSSDTTDGTAEPARAMAKALDGIIGTPIPGDEGFWRRHTEAATARGSALALIDIKDLAGARERFADLSVALDTLVRATGVPPGYPTPVQSLHCPMFREGQGGSIWLQAEGPVRNPFFGSAMLSCFDKRETIPVTGAAEPAVETPPAEKPGADSGPATPAVSPETQGAIDEAVGRYLVAQEALAADDAAKSAGALGRVREAVLRLEEASGGAGEHARAIAAAIGDLPSDLEPLREVFGKVSAEMIALVAAAPPSSVADGGLYRVHCPMVDKDWLQLGDKVHNPYDSEMPTCGKVEGEIQPRSGGESPQ